VFDVDSIGLTNMVRRLNHGADIGGNPIGEPTAFGVGVGVDPGATDIKREVARFEWKVDAGPSSRSRSRCSTATSSSGSSG